MAIIAFIGVGNMGGPMAANLVKAQHKVRAFDLSKDNLDRAEAAGAEPMGSMAEAVAGAEIVVTMLPAGPEVRAVYLGEGGIVGAVQPGTLLIDASTIDVESARWVAAGAAAAGLEMLDAPVSGGVGGAAAGTLTFMVGGTETAFARAEPVLQRMGKTIVHAGASGAGQAAKICNNMILGISMVAVSEGFNLAEKLGLDPQKLFDIASRSSGQCWSLTSYCPVPGPVPTSPANRDYQAGFTAAMMAKDMRLSQQAAQSAGAVTPLGAAAAQLYGLMNAAGRGQQDFSGIIRLLAGK